MTIIWTPDLKDHHAFYSCQNEYSEQLTHSFLDDAVYEYLDGLDAEDVRRMIENEETIDVTGWDRNMPSREECCFLKDLLENIDSDRDPYGNGTIKDMDAVKAAEQAFIDVLLANYEPWACERSVTISVNVDDWVGHLSSKDRERLFGKAPEVRACE